MAGTITATTQVGKKRGVVRVDCALAVTSSTTIAAAPIGSFFGRIVGIAFDPAYGTGTTIPSTADLTITDALTGATILSDGDFGTARLERPTTPVVGATGSAVTPATTANDVNRDIFVAGKLNLALAAAVNGDTGLVSLIIEEA